MEITAPLKYAIECECYLDNAWHAEVCGGQAELEMVIGTYKQIELVLAIFLISSITFQEL